MLFYLKPEDKAALEPVKAVSLASIGWKEEDLENLLSQHLERLVREEHLFVIARERRMQEEPDIMALDRDGRLYLFELKRGKSSAENVLQVLRYGQRFGQYEYRDLEHLFHSYLRKTTAKGQDVTLPALREAHGRYFDRRDDLLESDRFNKAQTFVLVTNGLDRASRQAIEYWSGQNLPIRSLVYRVYKTAEGSTLLEFDPFSPYPETMDEPDEGIFVVNTDIAYEKDAWKDMLNENKAAAYRDRKYAVTRITKGSIVCLYHTGVGIIALGRATGEYRRKSLRGEPDTEFYVPCEFEIKIDPYTEPNEALPAAVLNTKFGTSYRFRQTVFALPKEYLNFIQSELRRRQHGSADAR